MCINNGLDGHSQRAVVDSSMSRLKADDKRRPLGSILVLVLSNIFINDLVGLSVPSASVLMTLSCVVQLTQWKGGHHPDGSRHA